MVISESRLPLSGRRAVSDKDVKNSPPTVSVVVHSPAVPMPSGKGKKRLLRSPINPTPAKKMAIESPSTPVVIVSRRPRVRSSVPGFRNRRARRRYVARPTYMSPIYAAESIPMDTTETVAPTPSLSPVCVLDWRLTSQDNSFNFGAQEQSKVMDGEIELCNEFV